MREFGRRPPIRRDPALSAWRRKWPDKVDDADIASMREALATSPLLNHRRWPDALRGDPAAAIAVALDVLFAQGPLTLGADIAMTRLLVHAVERDPAAALVLGHALSRLTRETGCRKTPGRSDRSARGPPSAALPGPCRSYPTQEPPT